MTAADVKEKGYAFVDALVAELFPAPADPEAGGGTDAPQDPPPAADPAPPEGEGQGGAQTPEPTVVIFSAFDLKTPYHPAQGGTNVIALSKKYNARWKQGADDPATGTPIFADVQNGGTIILDGCIALFQWGSIATPPTQIWPVTPVPLPDGVWSPPGTGTSTPPASGSGGTTQPSTPADPLPDVPSNLSVLEVPAAPVDPADMRVELRPAGGQAMTFLGSAGRDLGDFVVPHADIVQRNVVVTDAAKDWFIYFRPDRDQPRLEVGVGYGNGFNPGNDPFGEYELEVFVKDRSVGKVSIETKHPDPDPKDPTVATMDCGAHAKLADWRVASAPRPQVWQPEDIVSNHFDVAYAATALTAAAPGHARAYDLLGRSSLVAWQPMTGERPEIGKNPEWHAFWMATRDVAMFASMRHLAEALGSAPEHLRDPDTGAMLDLNKYPGFTRYEPSQYSKPMFYGANGGDPYKKFWITPDAAHHPAPSWLVFLATGDPWHYERMCHQMNWLFFGEHSVPRTGRTFAFDRAQTRGFAWMQRSCVNLILGAKLISGGGLPPASYWQTALDNNRDYVIANLVASTEPKEAVFGSGTSRSSMGWWQEDYWLTILGAMVMSLGFSDWAPVLDWKLKSPTFRLSKDYLGGLNPLVYYAQYVKQEAVGGQMQFTPLSERGAQYPYVGDWTLTFITADSYTITDPGGVNRGTGTVGKVFTSGYVPAHMVIVSGIPGEVITWRITKIATPAELGDVNAAMGIVKRSTDGKMVIRSEDYAGSLYAALAASKSALLPDYAANLKDAGVRFPWRDSIAAGGGDA
jgi:hypothetical protein